MTQPPPLTPLPPPERPAPVIQEPVEEEEEDDYTASSDNNSIDNNSVADDNDAEEEISFKEPSLVIPSPPKSKSPSRLTSPLGQHNFQQPQAATPSPPRSTMTQHGVLNIVPPSQHGVKNSSRVSSHPIDPARNDHNQSNMRTSLRTKAKILSPPRVPLQTSHNLSQQNVATSIEDDQDLSVDRIKVKIKVPSPPPSPAKRDPSPPPPVVQRLSPVESRQVQNEQVKSSNNGDAPAQRGYGRRPIKTPLNALLAQPAPTPLSTLDEPEIEQVKSSDNGDVPLPAQRSYGRRTIKTSVQPTPTPLKTLDEPEIEPVQSSDNGDVPLPAQRSYGRRPIKTPLNALPTHPAPTPLKTLDEPEIKKFKPELIHKVDERPISKSISLHSELLVEEDSKNAIELKPDLIKSASLPASSSSNVDVLMPPPAALSGGAIGVVRPKKSFFKSKSKSGQTSGVGATGGSSASGQSRKGLASYKHSFGAEDKNKDDEVMREKVFLKAITDMDFEDEGPSPSEMSFRLVLIV